ncbi:MAG: hypothetical protein MUP16_01370 [Sedimentisphaerales bacterium]|nr:hypothetical protein [Sedimentisphaerales bacterium]
MEDNAKNPENEIDDLKQELEHFQQEKERVRKILGRIGGVPTFNVKAVNITFIILITILLVVSVIASDGLRLLMIEFAIVALSVKIIYLINRQMRMNHFEFWILSSLEWRINEISKQVKQLAEK